MSYKLLIPVLIIVAALLLAWFLCCKLTLKLDFSQAFKSTTHPAPQPNAGGLSIVLNGVDGDSAVVGFNFPDSGNSSEELSVTEKNLNEIKSSLDNLEIEQWEFLSNLPSSIFRFDVILSSYPDSPNKAKKTSYYLVSDFDGTTHKVIPGEKITLAHNSKIGDLPTTLSKVEVKLVYENGLYQNFYDQNGNMVSQATGELIIKPTIFLQILTIFGAWAFVVAALLLIKQTLMSSQGLKEVMDYFRNNI